MIEGTLGPVKSMANARKLSLVLCLASVAWAQNGVEPNAAASAGPTSGTLNLIIANKNGIIVAADSRMSSDAPFHCGRAMQRHCDNSQKLFRTGARSTMVIAGFAVDNRRGSPLDLSLASVLRNHFRAIGRPGALGDVQQVANWVDGELEQVLTGVAALEDPRTPPENLSVWATFAGFDSNGVPIIKQLLFRESWVPTGPLSILAPHYDVQSAAVTVTGFTPVPVGVRCVADAILSGHYRSTDPVIQAYYRKKREGSLDNATLGDMESLAKVILRETEKFTDVVGGEDQIAVLPVQGNPAWSLPAGLLTDTNIGARFDLKKGVTCSGGNPCTRGEPGYFEDFTHPLDEPISNFFLASEFNGTTVAMDDNYFVLNSFQNVRLKWKGSRFPYLLGNTFRPPCVLELPQNSDPPDDPQTSGLLANCTIERKLEVVVDPSTVGFAGRWEPVGHPCVTQNPGGGITMSAGGDCEKRTSVTVEPR